MGKSKITIYQLLPRLFHVSLKGSVINGDINQNGCGKFADINSHILHQIKDLGISHIWLTGLLNHACSTDYQSIGVSSSHPDLLKGKAGSPYAIRDYYDIHPDLALKPASRMNEFEELIGRIHASDMGLIMDFVPNHVSRDYHSLMLPDGEKDLGENDDNSCRFKPDNNFYYLPDEELHLPNHQTSDNQANDFKEYPAKVTGNDVFSSHPNADDWYETIKLNYGIDYETGQEYFSPVPNTWKKMTRILLFWAGKGIDGFRCDMAGMVPVEFWAYAIREVKKSYNNIFFIAEIYEPERYSKYINEGMFDYLYDKVGMYDTLRHIITENGSTHNITKHWQSLEIQDSRMLRFLENHDEQRLASKFFTGDPWKGLPAMAISLLMSGGPGIIYFGQELGEEAKGATGYSGDDGRTSIFDYTSVPSISHWITHELGGKQVLSSDQLKLRKAYQILLKLSSDHVFTKGQFYDLMWANEQLAKEIRSKVYAFIRHTNNQAVLVVCSFHCDLAEINIRIPMHAFKHIGQDHHNRFILKDIHPGTTKKTYLLSQMISSGVKVKFDRSGWSACSILFS